MIGYTKGYILRYITRKTKGLQVFLDDVNKLSLRVKSNRNVQEHLDNGGFIIALYTKDKLKGYYFFKVQEADCTGLKGYSGQGPEKCAVLLERFLGSGIPAETVRALDKEIQGSFLEDIAAFRFRGMVFDDRYITVEQKPLWKALAGGILFGLAVLVILLAVTRNTSLAVVIGLLWAAATSMISIHAELNKQKNALDA